MASKSEKRFVNKSNIIHQGNSRTKEKGSKHALAKAGKSAPGHTSLGHRISKSSKGKHSENKRQTILAYESKEDDTAGHHSPTQLTGIQTHRASPVITNDISDGTRRHRSKPAVNRMKTHLVTHDKNQVTEIESSASDRQSNKWRHKVDISAAKVVTRSQHTVESRNGTPEIEFPVDKSVECFKNMKGGHKDGTETRNALVSHTEMSSKTSLKNQKKVNQSDKTLRCHSAEYGVSGYEVALQSNKANAFIGTQSATEHDVNRAEPPTRIRSAPNRTLTSARRKEITEKSNSALYETGTPATNYSAVTSTPSKKSVKFLTDDDTIEMVEPETINNELVQGTRIGTPSVDSIRTDEYEIDVIIENTAKYKKNISLSSSLPGDPSRTKKIDVPSRTSPLMLGSGRVRMTNDIETLELHFDKSDYSNLVTQRSSSKFCISGSTSSYSKHQNQISPRPVEVQLPKTYITKTGSLFLYSDSKIMKDKQTQKTDNSRSKIRTMEVNGRKMSPRTLVPQAYPYWGKLVNSKKSSSTNDSRNSTGCSKRDQREYIGINNRTSNTNPYSWNYTVLPMKLMLTDEEKYIETVSNLSEAVLAYRSTSPTTEEKYLTMMRQTQDGKTQTEKLNERARQLDYLSTRTHDLVHSQSLMKCKKNTTGHNDQQALDGQTDGDVIARLRKTFEQSVFCWAPVNTPMVGSKNQKRQHTSMGSQYQKELSNRFSI